MIFIDFKNSLKMKQVNYSGTNHHAFLKIGCKSFKANDTQSRTLVTKTKGDFLKAAFQA
jgi:hypothetical protein